MLLSLLSRRTLEADSRDAYGFTVRPHHLHRYREYTNIYKEEEEERSYKWSEFLEQEAESANWCSLEEHGDTLQVEETRRTEEAVLDKNLGRDDSRNQNSVSDDMGVQNSVSDEPNLRDPPKQVPAVKGTKTGKVQRRAQSKPTIAAIENMFSLRIKDSGSTKDEQGIIGQNNLPQIEEAMQTEGASDENSDEDSCCNERLITSENHLAPIEEAMQPEVPKENSDDDLKCYEQIIKSENHRSPTEVEMQPEDVSEENSDADSCCNERLITSENHLAPTEEAVQPEEVPKENSDDDLNCYEQIIKCENHRSPTEVAKQPEDVSKGNSDGYLRSKEQIISENHLSPIGETKQLEGASEASLKEYPCSNNQLITCQNHLSPIEESMQLDGVSEENFEESCCDEILNNSTSSHSLESDDGDGEHLKPSFSWKEELESLVHGGVPKALRGEVWQAFVGVRTRRVKGYYQDMLNSEAKACDDKEHGVPMKWKKQIEKDLPRTFPGHPALNEYGRDSLRRVLLAYARHNPSVGYCQAMNFFAGLLLLMMPEENAFWTLVGIIDDYFDGYFSEDMIESQVDQLVFEELMREKFPKLVNHLDYLGVQVAWISAPWFLSIFVNMLPWESVLRVWDVLLFEGNRVMLFRTALALMELYGPALVTTKDAADAISLLQSLAGSTFDSSQLVLTACMGYQPITEPRLQELRKKHRQSVLLVIEERLNGSQVSKDSKGLASKLYSFKRPPKPPVEVTNSAQVIGDKLQDGDISPLNSGSNDFDVFFDGLTSNPEDDSTPDLQEQVDWMKVELCRLLEEKRSATLRAEELETALMEMVKQDNRRQLSAKVEQLEQEVTELRQVLADKKEQETAMLQVLMRVEQEQRLTEDARRSAEHDAAAQKFAVHILQEKYEKAMAAVAQMEKRVVMAESLLEATLQYESGQIKAQSSPRLMGSVRQASSQETRKTGLLFGLGWRDRNKAEVKPTNEGLDKSNSQKGMDDHNH